MPILNADFNPNFLLKNGHTNTILSFMFRKVKEVNYKRTRLDTKDKDFIDLDFSNVSSDKQADKIVLVTHGLEGGASRPYITGIAREANRIGWDAVGLNLRGCSGEPNLLYSSYHSGITADLEFVVDYLATTLGYKSIYLVGFSLGGNLTLKYLGEQGATLRGKVRSAAAISVPCQLQDCGDQLEHGFSKLYLNRFLETLKEKVKEKHQRFPEKNMPIEQLLAAKNFMEYDNLYTAPAHGFKDAVDYYTSCSSIHFIPEIKIPTLLINAMDDPFLAETCYPFDEAKTNPNFHFLATKHGGHVGFAERLAFKSTFWHEVQIFDFFKRQ